MDKISKYLIEYISFLNREKEDFFEEKSELNLPKKINKIFYKETEDILSLYLKNQLINLNKLNLKYLKKSKSYSNIKNNIIKMIIL